MFEPPEADIAVGMEGYASQLPPCKAYIKRSPEDFRVEEILCEIQVNPGPRKGYVPLYRVEKRLLDTLHLDRELSDALHSRISFAGLKDKRALTVQYFTPTSSRARSPQAIEGGRFKAELVGYIPRPLSRGSVRGNRFRVVIRDACPGIEDRLRSVFEMAQSRRLPNYFGLQRFGGSGALTHRIGRAIVKGNLEEAVGTMLSAPRPGDAPGTREARELFSKNEFREGSRMLPAGQDVERQVARHLGSRPGDFVGALRMVPIKLRRLYTHAYQSYLFNRALSVALRRGLDLSKFEAGDNWGDVTSDGLVMTKAHGTREPPSPEAVPLFQLAGYSYRNYGTRFDDCLEDVMNGEGVSARDFFVKGLQEVSVEGGFRRPHLAALDLSSSPEGNSVEVHFTLARGQYATVLLREAVRPTDPVSQGFA